MTDAAPLRCLFCPYECKASRTDVMRKHYQAHHKEPAAVLDKAPNPNYPAGSVVRANPHKANLVSVCIPGKDGERCGGAYCFGCWHEIKLTDRMDLHRKAWPAIVAKNHFCKERQVRPKRGSKKADTKPAKVSVEGGAATDIPVAKRDVISHVDDDSCSEESEVFGLEFVEAVKKESTMAWERLKPFVDAVLEDEEPDLVAAVAACLEEEPEEQTNADEAEQLRDQLDLMTRGRNLLHEQMQRQADEHERELVRMKAHYEAQMRDLYEEIALKRAAIKLLTEEVSDLTGNEVETVLENIEVRLAPLVRM